MSILLYLLAKQKQRKQPTYKSFHINGLQLLLLKLSIIIYIPLATSVSLL